MNGLRRGAVALASTTAILGMSILGSGTASAGESSTTETPLERVSALVQPSIVYLQQDWTGYIYDKTNKQYLNGGSAFTLSFQCTGFVVNPNGYIATAGHCVDPKEVYPSFYAQAAQWAVDNAYYADSTLTVDDILGFQSFRVDTLEKNGRADLNVRVGWGAAASGIDTTQVKRARVLRFHGSDAGDVALLKVEATDLNAVSLSQDQIETGTEVVSIGYPASVDKVTDPDLSPSYKEGSISSVKTVQGGLLTVYEISAAVSGGMSGGPTVNLDGEVVGVNSFGITGETQPFNFVRPSSQLSELLADAGVSNEMSETTQAYRDGLAAYWDGDKKTAVEQLSTVVEEQPSNKLATEYLDRAEELPDPKPPVTDEGGGFPVLPVAIGGGALVLVGGVVALLLLTRRGKGGAPVAPAPAAPPAPAATVNGAPPAVASTPVSAAPIGFGGPVPTPTPQPQAPAAPEVPAAPAAPVGAHAGPAPTPAAPADPAVPPVATVESPGPVATPAAPAVVISKFCGNCGTPSRAGERFCENCGESLVR